MTLTNLEQDGSLSMNPFGEDKAVVMTTTGGAVPYSAYYDMPNGYVDWLTITVSGNVFTVEADSNAFGDEVRSIVVRFFCIDTFGTTAETKIVTVTQEAGALALMFAPSSVQLDMAGTAVSVDIVGIPQGSLVAFDKPSWVTVAMTDDDTMSVSAEPNMLDTERSGLIYISLNGMWFSLAVTQAENTVELSLDIEGLSIEYDSTSPYVVTVTGAPVDATITATGPDWLKLSIDQTTDKVTITPTKNSGFDTRNGTVIISVYGRTANVNVSQRGDPNPFGKLTLDTVALLVPNSGGTYRIVATSMPTNATELTLGGISEINCIVCGGGAGIIDVRRVSNKAFDVIISPQSIFGGDERTFTVTFDAGNTSSVVTITQEAAPKRNRLVGLADKFVKRVESRLEPSYLIDSVTQNTYLALTRASWEPVYGGGSAKLISGSPDSILTDPGSLEVYKANFDRQTISGAVFQKIGMSAVAFKFKFGQLAVGQEISGMRISIRGDAYCVEGLRVALVVSDDNVAPSPTWSDVRNGDAHYAALAKRYPKNDNYYGSSLSVVFDDLGFTISENTTVLVYMSMEDYIGVYNGWLYGSGIVSPFFEFVADGLSGDLADDDIITIVDDENSINPDAIAKGAMVLGVTAFPATASSIPYREVAFLEHNIWDTPPIPKHLLIDTTAKYVVPSGDTFTVNILEFPDNYNTFSVENIPAWITHTKTATSVTFSVQASTPGQIRSADVEIKSGGESVTLRIDQQADEITYLSVSTATLSFPATGDTKTTTVQSLPNGILTFTSHLGAIHEGFSHTQPGNPILGATLSVTASAQPVGAAQRSSTLYIDAGGQQVRVTCTQAQGEAATHLVLSSSQVSCAYDVSPPAVNITSLPNGVSIGAVTIGGETDWLTALVHSSPNRISFAGDVNGGGERVAVITVTAGTESKTITVSQGANPTALSVSPTYAVLGSAGGSLTATIVLPTGATTPTFSGVSGLTGSISGNILTMTVAANTSGSQRSLTGTISTTVGGTPYTTTYTVHQGFVEETSFTSKLALATRNSPFMGIIKQAVGDIAGVNSVYVYDNIAFVCGTFSNLLGHNVVCPIDMTTLETLTWSNSDPMAVPGTTSTAATIASATACSAVAKLSSNIYLLVLTVSGTLTWRVVKRSGSTLSRNYERQRSDTTGGPYINAALRMASTGSVAFGITSSRTIYRYVYSTPFVSGYYYDAVDSTSKSNAVGAVPSAIASDGTYFYVAGNFGGNNLVRSAASSINFSATTLTSATPPAARFTPNSFTNLNISFGYDGKLIATGAFTSIDGLAIKHVAKWNGSAWEPYFNDGAEINATVNAGAASGANMVVVGGWTKIIRECEYLGPIPSGIPDVGGVTMIPQFDAVDLPDRQAVVGVRNTYAKAFSGAISPFDFSETGFVQKQYGINAVLRRKVDEVTGDDKVSLTLSTLLTRFEVPETFVTNRVRIVSPGGDLFYLPEGSDIRLTIWWAENKYLELPDISALSNNSLFWSGLSATVSGERTVVVGQASTKLSVSLKRVGRVVLTENELVAPYIEIPVSDVKGVYGTMLTTAWLNLDNIVAIPSGEVWGVGKLCTESDGTISTVDDGWTPSVFLVR